MVRSAMSEGKSNPRKRDHAGWLTVGTVTLPELPAVPLRAGEASDAPPSTGHTVYSGKQIERTKRTLQTMISKAYP